MTRTISRDEAKILITEFLYTQLNEHAQTVSFHALAGRDDITSLTDLVRIASGEVRCSKCNWWFDESQILTVIVRKGIPSSLESQLSALNGKPYCKRCAPEQDES